MSGFPTNLQIGPFVLKVLEADLVNDLLIHRWSALEQRAVESNAYLSPHFVLPAVKHFPLRGQPIFVFVEKNQESETRLVGFGVFERMARSSRMPLPHLRAYRSPHSYLSGLLIDRDDPEEVLKIFFSFFKSPQADWSGVEFVTRSQGSILARALESVASRMEVPWFEYFQQQRAILQPCRSGDEFLKTALSSKRKKIIRRGFDGLKGLGPVSWRLVRGENLGSDCIETFLQLEDMGWKASEQTSLRSQPEQEAFFRDKLGPIVHSCVSQGPSDHRHRPFSDFKRIFPGNSGATNRIYCHVGGRSPTHPCTGTRRVDLGKDV